MSATSMRQPREQNVCIYPDLHVRPATYSEARALRTLLFQDESLHFDYQLLKIHKITQLLLIH